MPAAPGDRTIGVDVGGGGDIENLPAARQSMLHHLPAVLADRVVDPRRRDPMTVLQDGIDRDAFVLLREILADRGDTRPMAVEIAEHAMMIGAPRQTALLLAHH